MVRFTGRKPARRTIDMSGDPACVEAHHGRPYDESVVVNPNGTLANVFIRVKSGLETLQVTNSDPGTHNIHPLPRNHREWNHSQGQGDAPLVRKFMRPEAMIRVKCNIHSWMLAFIGVVEHPYFSVTGSDGTFEIPNVPPGDYVIEAWQETLGALEQKIAVTPSGKSEIDFVFKGE
jgi:hypothetical protein